MASIGEPLEEIEQEPVRFRASRDGYPTETCFGLRFENYVIGSTLNYGRVVTATKGMRAEKAVPEYLVLSDNDDFNVRLLEVAEEYGMKLCSLEEAKAMPTGLMPYGGSE